MRSHPNSPLKLKGATSPPPIGRCIYCDSTQEPLTKEHIVPQSLRGRLTLRRASCEDCRETTRRIETVIARDVYQDVRATHGFKIKEPPLLIPMRAGPARDAPITHYVKPEDAPRFLFLFEPEEAGILIGRTKGEGFKAAPRLVALGDDTERFVRRQALGLPSEFHRDFPFLTFGRFLAKISLGISVWLGGLNSFDPTDIRRLILGQDDDWSHLVGGTPDDMVILGPSLSNRGHRIASSGANVDGRIYGVVQIQLFAHLLTPIYTVVVGELNETGIKQLGPKDHILYA